MTADYADGVKVDVVDVDSAKTLEEILRNNAQVHVILYDGEWEKRSGTVPFYYQYTCYSVLYPRMKFCRVRKDCSKVADMILEKFGLEPEPEEKNIAFRTQRKNSADGNCNPTPKTKSSARVHLETIERP
ncbi:hypothetical protein ABW20_dc0102355 [Dactylellina cionopaga]|nr:hypothetical protein ABW20_dc0102355 [Dactylellina cionopaga]